MHSIERLTTTEVAMLLEGSCHCRSVRFTVVSHTPYPYMRCYCSICRKTAGGGGYAINIMGDASTLSVKGAKHMTIYRAWIAAEDGKRRRRSEGRRHFCAVCGAPALGSPIALGR